MKKHRNENKASTNRNQPKQKPSIGIVKLSAQKVDISSTDFTQYDDRKEFTTPTEIASNRKVVDVTINCELKNGKCNPFIYMNQTYEFENNLF